MATKYPPQLNLNEAIRVIKEIYTHGSKEMPLDLMPEILKTSKTSSQFATKINALQSFGFITKRPNDIIELTELAMRIIKPIDAEDESEAKDVAFHNIDVLTALLEKYPTQKLPSEHLLKATLIKQFEVPEKTANQWYQFVVESFREVSITKTENRSISQTMNNEPKPNNPNSNYTFTIPVNDKENISVSIPKSVTSQELNMLKAFIDAIKPNG